MLNIMFFLNKPINWLIKTLDVKPIRPLTPSNRDKEQIGPRRTAGQHSTQFLLRPYEANILLACQKKPWFDVRMPEFIIHHSPFIIKNCWCLYRGGPTSSLSEQSRQAPQGQWYCPLAGGRVGRRQLNI